MNDAQTRATRDFAMPLLYKDDPFVSIDLILTVLVATTGTHWILILLVEERMTINLVVRTRYRRLH